MRDTTTCPHPTCTLPATITNRYVLESTDGPVEHIATRCHEGHTFNMPTAILAARKTRWIQ